jgi:3-isopropylmalate dehydrogenase
MTRTIRLAVIGGDGIGPEVVAEALKVLRGAVGSAVQVETTDFHLGATRYLETGDVLPDAELDAIAGHDAILLGAVGGRPGDPRLADANIERGLLLKLRFALDHYVNLRPTVLYPGFSSPLKDPGAVEFVVVREGTEGPYAGNGGRLRAGTPAEVATEVSVNTAYGVERVVRYAFAKAAERRNRLTLVHKTNVLTFAGDLWQRSFDDVAAEYADVATGYHHVDAACIHLVQDPGRYDVIVTDNLFGDILTDLAGAVSGGIGRAASANLNPARTGPSLFEPVHGSAPDIAGTGQADPRAAIISVAMLLEFLGETEAAARVEKAVAASDDVKGTTSEIGDTIAGKV